MEEINQINELELRKGIIYCIVCNITGEKYYGSTFNINKRMARHRLSNNPTMSKQIIERGNYSVQILMDCYVPNKLELHKIEAEFIKNNQCINKLIPYRSDEEKKQLKGEYCKKRYQNTKIEQNIYCKNYYHNNKQYFSNKAQEYKKNCKTIACECGGQAKEYNLGRHYKSKKHQDYLRHQQQQGN